MKFVSLVLALLTCASPAFGAAAYDAVSSSSVASGASLAFNHTNGGSNRVLYCGVGWANAGFRTMEVAYNTVPMTSISQAIAPDFSQTVEVFRLIAPTVGTNQVSVTVGGGTDSFTAGCISVNGAHQVTPEGTIVTDSTTDGTPSATITVSTDGIGLSFGMYRSNGTTCDDTTSGNTERFDLCEPDNDIEGYGSSTVVTGAIAMSWVTVNTTYAALVAIPIEPAAAVGGSATPGRRVNFE
jgi:hypothetical protein